MKEQGSLLCSFEDPLTDRLYCFLQPIEPVTKDQLEQLDYFNLEYAE